MECETAVKMDRDCMEAAVNDSVQCQVQAAVACMRPFPSVLQTSLCILSTTQFTKGHRKVKVQGPFKNRIARNIQLCE